MKTTTVNLAIQVLPQSDTLHPYKIVDKAIELIQLSGLKYRVCPFETVVEGTLDEVFQLARAVHDICYAHGTTQMMTYLKIQSRNNEDVTIEDKMEPYE